MYVDALNNEVKIGAYASYNSTKLNVYTNLGTNYTTGSNLTQNSIYQSSVYNRNDSGEGGITLQHGSSETTAAQWGISAHRTGSNVGELIFRTRTANSTSATRLVISNGGNVLPGADSDQDFGNDGTRWQNIYSDITHALNSVRVAKGTANSEADLQLRGGGTGNGGGRGFRIGSNIGGGADILNIYSSQTNGSDNWKSLAGQAPIMSMAGSTNRVGINTNSTSGTDTTVSPNVSRNYILNVQGDMNLNGQLFQNNAEFVTSRWTESPNGNDIYRASRVGIGFSSAKNPDRALEVQGSVEVTEYMYANDDQLWADTYSIIRLNRTTIDQSLSIPNSKNAMSSGPITINNGRTITIPSGTSWSIV